MILIGKGACALRLAGQLGATLIDLSRDDPDAALAAIADDAELIMFVAMADAALRPRPFESLADKDWREGATEPIELWFAALKGLSVRYEDSPPPPIVLAGPSLALSGAEGLALLAAAAEGQRALMKSAARQLGVRGFRFTWLAIDNLLFAPELHEAALPKSQDPDPLATGGAPSIAALADTLALLTDPRARALTGQSLVLDGGELMLP